MKSGQLILFEGVVGERGRNRTFNLLIKSQLLCQLSYAPTLDRTAFILVEGPWGTAGSQGNTVGIKRTQRVYTTRWKRRNQFTSSLSSRIFPTCNSVRTRR
jgi:hypothetical protein